MDDDIATAKKYRKRAEEIRTIADGMLDSNSRNILLSISKDYDRMAVSLDRIEETDRIMAARPPVARG
jgi:acetone carboxylase gamma subunit